MATNKAKGPGYEMLFNRLDDMLYNLAEAFLEGRSSAWPVLSRERVHAVWSAYVADGYVRNEDALEVIFESIRDNVLRLECATIAAGHTGHDPAEFLEGCGLLSEPQFEPFSDWLIETDAGWRISDYGLDPLSDAVACAFEAHTPAEKLKCLDRALHVTHQRGDLSKLFIEGGRLTVTALADPLEMVTA